MKRTKDNIFELTNMLETIRYEDLHNPDPLSPEPEDKFVTPPESENPSLTASLVLSNQTLTESKQLEITSATQIYLPNDNQEVTSEESKIISEAERSNSSQLNESGVEQENTENTNLENEQLDEKNIEKEEATVPLSNLRCSHSACDGDKCKFEFYIPQNPAKPKKILGIKNKSSRKRKKASDSVIKLPEQTKSDVESVNHQTEGTLKNITNIESDKDDFTYKVEFSESVFWSVPVVSVSELDLSEAIDRTDNNEIGVINNSDIEKPDNENEIILKEECIIERPDDDQVTKSKDIIIKADEDKEEKEQHAVLNNGDAPTIFIEQPNQQTENNESVISILTVVNEIVDAASSVKDEVENFVDTENAMKVEPEQTDDNITEAMEELKPIRQRIPSSASSDGRISRKISYEDGSMVDPIDMALNDLRLSVSEFCDICLQELHGL